MNDAQEQNVSAAFSRQAPMFDDIDDANSIISWMRNRVRDEVLSYIQPSSRILELNCGTGIDSIFFAKRGHKVIATDNAPGMLQKLDQKIEYYELHSSIITQQCSFNELEKLKYSAPFDYVFSNFGGLNCTDQLGKVLADINRLLKPGGYFSLVIMPVVCPWEMIMFFRGYFKTAFRRFKKGGTTAHLEGIHFDCYYYNPSFIISRMKDYELCGVKGLSITVPPPYIEGFKEKYPRLFRMLEKAENTMYTKTPFNRWADHYIITMRKPF